MQKPDIKQTAATLAILLGLSLGVAPLSAQESLVPTARLDRARAFETALESSHWQPTQMLAPKSKYKAALLSALIPGMGEAYAGHKGRAIAFGTVEAGIWVTYGAYKIQESVRHDRAIEFAVAAAGANGGGTEDYYKSVARFLRSDGPGMWNEYVRRQARDSGEVVGPEYYGIDAWAWTSEANLEAYRELRRRELSASENATNMFAFALINRVLSVIDAVYVVSKDHRAMHEGGFGLELDTGGSTMARLMLQNRF